MDGLYFGFMAVFGHRYMSVGATTVSADKIYSIVLLGKTTSTVLPPVLLVYNLSQPIFKKTEKEQAAYFLVAMRCTHTLKLKIIEPSVRSYCRNVCLKRTQTCPHSFTDCWIR